MLKKIVHLFNLQIHRSLNLLAIALMCAGLLVVFVAYEWRWTGPKVSFVNVRHWVIFILAKWLKKLESWCNSYTVWSLRLRTCVYPAVCSVVPLRSIKPKTPKLECYTQNFRTSI